MSCDSFDSEAYSASGRGCRAGRACCRTSRSGRSARMTIPLPCRRNRCTCSSKLDLWPPGRCRARSRSLFRLVAGLLILPGHHIAADGCSASRTTLSNSTCCHTLPSSMSSRPFRSRLPLSSDHRALRRHHVGEMHPQHHHRSHGSHAALFNPPIDRSLRSSDPLRRCLNRQPLVTWHCATPIHV